MTLIKGTIDLGIKSADELIDNYLSETYTLNDGLEDYLVENIDDKCFYPAMQEIEDSFKNDNYFKDLEIDKITEFRGRVLTILKVKNEFSIQNINDFAEEVFDHLVDDIRSEVSYLYQDAIDDAKMLVLRDLEESHELYSDTEDIIEEEFSAVPQAIMSFLVDIEE